MPVESKSQLRYVMAAKGRGEQWARDWYSKYIKGKSMKGLPEEKADKEAGLFGIFLESFNKTADILAGGKADKAKPSNFNKKELIKGTAHEKEHTSSPGMAREIAMDHLKEDGRYYTHLSKMEEIIRAGKRS